MGPWTFKQKLNSKYLITFLTSQTRFWISIDMKSYKMLSVILAISKNGCDIMWYNILPWCPYQINTLRPRQNGRYFADDTFKRIFLKENIRISTKLSLNFLPKSPVDNIPSLFQIMAWRRPGDKPLSEAMMVSLLTHMCNARPQWVNWLHRKHILCYYCWCIIQYSTESGVMS